MNKAKMKKYLENTLNMKDPKITEMRRTPGGMTNDSYFVKVNGEKFVVRIPGKGTDELIDRHTEKNNLIYGTELGVNPELIHFDIKSGIKVTRMIEYSKTLTPEFAREGQMMKRIIAIFQRLHRSNTVMNNRFELFDLLIHYENLVQGVNPLMAEKLAAVKGSVSELEKVYESLEVQEAPCHIDACPANVLLDMEDDRLYLIDWEYSGMFDPMWDIATLSQTLSFTEEEEFFFLKLYLERDPNQKEIQRVLLHKVFQDYLWSLWTIFKEAKGDEFGQLASQRIERAIENIEMYNRKYNFDIVV